MAKKGRHARLTHRAHMAGHGRDYTIWGLVLPIYLPTFIFAVSEGIAIPVVPLMVFLLTQLACSKHAFSAS